MYDINEYSHTIYAIQHNVTGRVYVGMTKDLGSRLSVHFSALKRNVHPNYLLQKDCYEHGFDYSVFILEPSVNGGKDSWKERYYIQLLNTDDPDIGYNGYDPMFRTDYKWRFVDGMPKMNKKKGGE